MRLRMIDISTWAAFFAATSAMTACGSDANNSIGVCAEDCAAAERCVAGICAPEDVETVAYVVSGLALPEADANGGFPGFNLDRLDSTADDLSGCRVEDVPGRDGATGVDNALAPVLNTLSAIVGRDEITAAAARGYEDGIVLGILATPQGEGLNVELARLAPVGDVETVDGVLVGGQRFRVAEPMEADTIEVTVAENGDLLLEATGVPLSIADIVPLEPLEGIRLDTAVFRGVLSPVSVPGSALVGGYFDVTDLREQEPIASQFFQPDIISDVNAGNCDGFSFGLDLLVVPALVER